MPDYEDGFRRPDWIREQVGGDGAMSCREIADEFIVAVDWTQINRKQDLLRMIENYPFGCIDVVCLNATLAREAWIQ